jgi:GT2 family glycosyltransferase
MKTPSVSLILLNWNQPHFTLACLRSLDKVTYPNFDVIVVDNGSADNSIEQIESIRPELKYNLQVITNKRNLGFAEGNNVGIRAAMEQGANYVLLLNNDTEVDPDFIQPLMKMAQSNPKIGITGPKIYYYDDPKLIWSAGGVFTRSGWTQQLGVNERDSEELNRLRQVDYVSGCAMLVKRAVIEKAGMLDPRFFIYYEETDWCARTAKAGFTIWYVPESVLWHKISLQARNLSPTYIYLMTRNRLLFMRNLGLSPLRVLASMVAVDVRTVIAWTVWKRHASARPLRQWRIRGVLDYLQGKFGEPAFNKK